MTTLKKPRRMARPPYVDGSGTENPDGQIATEPADVAGLEKRVTKQSLVLDLLQRDGGASLAEIVEATGWLPHTARAALTGLRKKGHAIERTSIAGESRYQIAVAAAQ
jgi:hypothetical protein